MGFITRPSEYEIEHHVQIFAGQAYAATHGGSLPDTRFWREMEFRRSLNPARFDHWHHNIGWMLEHDGNHASRPIRPHSWVGRMRGPAVPIVPQRPVEPTTPILNPRTIPEPASLATLSISLALWLAAAFILGRRETRNAKT